MIRRLRRAVRGAVNGFERLLHPWRRRRVLQRVSRGGAPDTLLVLCHGNICRSPYAAERLRQLFRGTAGAPRIESAGYILPDRKSPEIACRVAHRRGIDLDEHRSRVVDIALAEEASAVLVMTPGQRRDFLRDMAGTRPPPVMLLGDFDDQQPLRRMISDPYGHEEKVFEEVFERIDRCCRALHAALVKMGVDPAAPDS